MKQKLIALLKTSFASKGFNAKELESLADLIISQQSLTDDSTDEDLTTAVTVAKPVADFVQSVASRQVSDVKKPGKVEEPANPVVPVVEPAVPTTTDPVLLALLTEIKELKTGLTNLNTEKVATTRRERYAKALEGKSPEIIASELKKFDKMSFIDDADFDTTLAEFTQDLANSDLGNDQPAGGFGKVPSGEKEVSSLMKGYLETQAAKAPKAVTV